MRIVEAMAIFMARRYEIFPSTWRAMLLATIAASSSGRFTSKMFIWTSFLVIFLSSSFSLSTSCPPLPMMMPGRAVFTVTVMSLRVRSMTIFERLALASLAFRYSLILVSSTSLPEKSLPPYQFESHPLMIPILLPIGFTFCPIVYSEIFSTSCFLLPSTRVTWFDLLRIR
ncbi:MAG: hypothetical protein BWY89_01258 [Bacteroidetes bacterium ADurb.BinA012]|nr:MAG: hypothetical protein BWY89_01258 [Bacteroidetes bacterium ADurb.BinA012]